MKRFAILFLVCVLGYFLAPTVLGIRASSGTEYANKGVYSAVDKEIFSTRTATNGSTIPVTTISLLLDLEEAEQVKEPTKLLTVEGNARTLGLMLTKDGMVGYWEGKPWGTDMGLALSRMLENPNVIRVKGRDCLALTVLVSGSVNKADKTPGVTVVDSSGDSLLRYPALNSVLNKDYRAIEVSETLVSHVMIAPKLLSVKAAGKRTARLEKAVSVKPGNALVAFGGGGVALLVLSALWAAGWRRKPETR